MDARLARFTWRSIHTIAAGNEGGSQHVFGPPAVLYFAVVSRLDRPSATKRDEWIALLRHHQYGLRLPPSLRVDSIRPMGEKLAALAAVLLDDEAVVSAKELQGLFAAFAITHGQASALEAAWDAKPNDDPNSTWLAAQSNDDVFMHAATDLVLTVLFGAIYVNKMVASATDPGWVFTGRFWSLIKAHAPALSAGPFGHWSYRPGAQ